MATVSVVSDSGKSTHDAILDAAREVFRDVGFNGATMLRIAALAGVSYEELLQAFPDKNELLQELLATRDAEDEARMRLDSITDPHDALEAVVDVARRNTEHRGLVELYTVLAGESVSTNNPGHDFFATRYRDRLDLLTRTYRRGQEAGFLKADWDPALAAAHLVALLDGLQIQWLLSNGETDMVGIIRRHLARQIAEPAQE